MVVSAGVKHELIPNLAISLDYVGNRGRDQTALIDINEPHLLSTGQRARPGVSVFDPSGTLVPVAARGANFLRVLQYQTRDDLNTDYNALELSIEKRFADRWSGRFSYTLSRARDVGSTGGGTTISTKRVNDDLNPRLDYGRTNFGNPTGSRQSTNFLIPVRANDPRTMRLGIRYTF